MSFSLRSGPLASRASESGSIVSSSQAAVEASRAAALAWQGKRRESQVELRKAKHPGVSSSRVESSNTQYSGSKRPSAPDTKSLFDTPLIDFSDSSMDTAPSMQDFNFQSYVPLSPAPTPPSRSPQPEAATQSRQKYVSSFSNRQLERSGAIAARHSKASAPTAPSQSVSDVQLDPVQQWDESPISAPMPDDVSPGQELSREELALKNLKGVDESLARAILNDIVVRGDEVQWDDIGIT